MSDENEENKTSGNFSEFPFEKELEARKLASKMFIDHLTEKTGLIQDGYKGNLEDINYIQNRLKAMKRTEDEQVMECQILEKDIKLKFEEIENLKSGIFKLESDLEKLERDRKATKKEYKFTREAYDTALKKYCTNFDLDLQINSVSEEIFEALITFKIIKYMEPIKVVVDRTKGKVLELDTNKLLTDEERNRLCEDLDVLKNTPRFLAHLRKYLLNK